MVAQVRPLRRGLILGGTRVHDWFHAHRRIDRVLLTVEPLDLGGGLPLFSGAEGPAEAVLAARGYRQVDSRLLNRGGTRLLTFLPHA
jgi:dihydrofolate reductase